jgi:hypothetical protein
MPLAGPVVLACPSRRSEQAQAADQAPDFPARIRDELPMPNPPVESVRNAYAIAPQ